MKKTICLMIYFISSTSFGAINNGSHSCVINGKIEIMINLSKESLTIKTSDSENKTYYFNKDQSPLFKLNEEKSEFAGDKFRDPKAVYRLTRRHPDRINLMEVKDTDYGYSERVTITNFRFNHMGKLSSIYLSGTSSDGHNDIPSTPIICE